MTDSTVLNIEGARRLAANILLVAVADASCGNREARTWLQDEGVLYAELLGFSRKSVKDWCKAGCALPALSTLRAGHNNKVLMGRAIS